MTRAQLWQRILDANPSMQEGTVCMKTISLRKMFDLVYDKAQEELAAHMNGRESGDVVDDIMGLFNGS